MLLTSLPLPPTPRPHTLSHLLLYSQNFFLFVIISSMTFSSKLLQNILELLFLHNYECLTIILFGYLYSFLMYFYFFLDSNRHIKIFLLMYCNTFWWCCDIECSASLLNVRAIALSVELSQSKFNINSYQVELCLLSSTWKKEK